MSLTEESEEQAIDRLLSELGIRLPVVEVDTDGDDLSGPTTSQEAVQTFRMDEFRVWWPIPFS